MVWEGYDVNLPEVLGVVQSRNDHGTFDRPAVAGHHGRCVNLERAERFERRTAYSQDRNKSHWNVPLPLRRRVVHERGGSANHFDPNSFGKIRVGDFHHLLVPDQTGRDLYRNARIAFDGDRNELNLRVAVHNCDSNAL